MPTESLKSIFEVSANPHLAEVGGAHNQKGIDFQRCWALIRMFELEGEDVPDFLFLFETLQDVAILDSESAPSGVCVYQIKKKDRSEWSWAELTDLHKPAAANKKSPADVQGSPLGKLYATVRALKFLESSGRFVSNAGCDLALANGGNAATSTAISLETLPQAHQDLLIAGFGTLHAEGEEAPELSSIHLERVALPVDDPSTYVVGVAHNFLHDRSPEHAGQARSLVDALLAQIGPLGAKTDACQSFEELRKHRGFSRNEFTSAIGEVQSVPDLQSQLTAWLTQLRLEGMPFQKIQGIRTAAAGIMRRRLMGEVLDPDAAIDLDCDVLVAAHAGPPMLPLYEAGEQFLRVKYPQEKVPELLARLVIRDISNAGA